MKDLIDPEPSLSPEDTHPFDPSEQYFLEEIYRRDDREIQTANTPKPEIDLDTIDHYIMGTSADQELPTIQIEAMIDWAYKFYCYFVEQVLEVHKLTRLNDFKPKSAHLDKQLALFNHLADPRLYDIVSISRYVLDLYECEQTDLFFNTTAILLSNLYILYQADHSPEYIDALNAVAIVTIYLQTKLEPEIYLQYVPYFYHPELLDWVKKYLHDDGEM